jgi:hypothetical protein
MAALKVNPDNSITLPFPLLAILVTLTIALAGWGNSLRGDVADLVSWKVEHMKQDEAIHAQQNGAIAEIKNMVQVNNAETAKANATFYEQLTNIRIQIASARR